MTTNRVSDAENKYSFEEESNRFRFDSYDELPGFCSFLPGLGGLYGVPLWCMYVNRGQSVVSYGVADKEHPILEFLPATWAYQLVTIQGFRTFCKINGSYYEPFQRDAAARRYEYRRTMWVESDKVRIQEQNRTLGLQIDVEYFSPPDQPLGTLVRHVTLHNTSARSADIELMDGLPVIVPAGFNDFGLKKMRHIMEAYAVVRPLTGKVPFYAAKVQAHDEAEVVEVKEGNFYAAWCSQGETFAPIEPFVDPHVIFGGAGDLVTPRNFITQTTLDRNAQVWENRIPCALVPASYSLAPGDFVELWVISGHAPTGTLAERFLMQFRTPSDFEALAQRSTELMQEVTRPAFSLSSQPVLDAYNSQNYLDNVLRGGVPLLLPSRQGPTPLHVYARRHGDLERDYNSFELPPTPLSGGAGNYRDICQNRRYDVWFYPDLFDEEIRMFLELIQADGFNPLAVSGYRWQLPENADPLAYCPATDERARQDFLRIITKPFAPGDLLAWADEYLVAVSEAKPWIEQILSGCDRKLVAGGHEGGYWIDHWIYIVDLLESFAGLWPDKVEVVLTKEGAVGWFDGRARVVPRAKKYVQRSGGPMQLNAVTDAPSIDPPLPAVSPLAKLCALLAVKAVSLDYAGQGMEMEAGRPGWNDSMNGLPALFGSSTCETAAAARLARWLREMLPRPPKTAFPLEVANFIEFVRDDMAQGDYNWDRAATIREEYIERLQTNHSSEMRSIPGEYLTGFLAAVERRMLQGVEASVDKDIQLVHTYFMAKPDQVAEQSIEDTSFERKSLPLFLEGQVHWLRLLQESASRCRAIYQSVRKSGLFDPELRMYKICECLDGMPKEVGRARTFSRGWFENESVWLHMSYKYLVELLRCGLHREFFDDAKTMLVPFMNPERYGRSLLENSSFIACSACPDPKARGRGFIARLSGSTVEFIHLWLLLTAGRRPFRMTDGELRLELAPVLPGEWFTTEDRRIQWKGSEHDIPENSLACAFLGDILLVYHNESRRDSFGANGVRPKRYQLEGQQTVERNYLAGEQAEQVRNRKARRLDVWLG